MSDNPITEQQLAMKAAAIRAIGKRAVCDLIEIGRLLTDAKLLAGHGNWLPWLDREFGWSDGTARKWMNVYELSLKFQPDWDLDLPLGALYLLSSRSTPPPVLATIIERAETRPPARQRGRNQGHD